MATFWYGAPLGPIEQISALSMLDAGHKLIVYTRGDIKGVPPGIEVRDAGEILDTGDIVRHRKTGSVALYSDLFRYALFNKTDYTWVDLDVVALRPLPTDSPYLFGYESRTDVNGAVLRLPRQSPALARLSNFTVATRGYPPTITGLRRLKYVAKSLGRGLPIAEWPWGSLGPRALTHFLGQTGEISHALTIDAFYPIPFEQAARFAAADDLSLESFSSDVLAVHLWGKVLRQCVRENHNGRIPANSFLDKAAHHYSTRFGFEIPSVL